MKTLLRKHGLLAFGLLLTVVLAACAPVVAAPPAAEDPPALTTASVLSTLSNQPGRAILSARGNHFIVDSIPPLGGADHEMNPLDELLGALATCGTFVYEAAAQELSIPLSEITTYVDADFDPRGLLGIKVNGKVVNPRLQAIRVHFDMVGPNEEQAEALADQWRTRCPVYTTLERSAPITLTTGEKPDFTPEPPLKTASVVSQLSNQPGRAIVSTQREGYAKHFVVDSVPPLNGPNEEKNPMDLLLGALAVCPTFIYEAAAKDKGIPLESIATTVEGDFDPRGLKAGSGISPRIQALRVTVNLVGPSEGQANQLEKEFLSRCPIYNTLVRSAPIEVENVLGD